MKTMILAALSGITVCGVLDVCKAAVVQTPGLISVEGVINGSSGTPFEPSDTLDYLKFEVLTTTSITVTSGFGGNAVLLLAQFTGDNDEFGFLGDPYRLVQTSSETWDSFTRTLFPGVYVTAMGVLTNTSYDIFDGFVAVNPEGGGFTVGNYAYSIAGDVRALEFWDGELDGTFKITYYDVPEPSGAALGLLTAGLALQRRRRT